METNRQSEFGSRSELLLRNCNSLQAVNALSLEVAGSLGSICPVKGAKEAKEAKVPQKQLSATVTSKTMK
jgi:hypothetical protein